MNKMTINEAVTINKALGDLEASTVKVPIKLFYAIGKTRKGLADTLKTFEESRIELAKKYAKIHTKGKDKGEPVVTKDGNYDLAKPKEFQKDLTDLLKEEVEVQIHQVKIDEFADLAVSAEDNPFLYVLLDHLVWED